MRDPSATHDRLTSGESASPGGSFQINDLILNKHVFVLGKFKGCNSQLIASPIVKGETGNIMRHHSPNTTGDSRKEFAQIEIRDKRVVDFQNHPRAVTLLSQRLLMTLRFDCYRNLPCQESCEFEIEFIVDAC